MQQALQAGSNTAGQRKDEVGEYKQGIQLAKARASQDERSKRQGHAPSSAEWPQPQNSTYAACHASSDGSNWSRR